MDINKKVLISSFLGNALEFYDFTLYGVFAGLFAVQFFPATDSFNGILASWGAFAAGFLMRPFGASLFGFIGDKVGRKKALSLSIIMMGVPTLFLGVLPNYQTIGVMAPILLVVCRLFQGLCTGGEYNGASIFAIEHHAGKGQGVISGLMTSSCVLGALSATGVSFLIIRYGNQEWGWRGAFILGAFISFVGFFIRKNIQESPDFQSQENMQSTYFSHLIDTFTNHTSSFIITFLFGCMNGALSYSLFGFLNMYLNMYQDIPKETAIFSNLFGLLAFMISCPLAGYRMDQRGIRKYVFQTYNLLIVLPFVAYFLFTLKSLEFLIIGQIIYGILVGIIAGPQHAIIQTFFPVQYRYTGVSLSFCLGMAIVGGTTPLTSFYLIEKTNNIYAPAIMVSVLGVIVLTNYLIFIRRKASIASLTLN